MTVTPRPGRPVQFATASARKVQHLVHFLGTSVVIDQKGCVLQDFLDSVRIGFRRVLRGLDRRQEDVAVACDCSELCKEDTL